jgi:microcin C transport system permease protein
MMSPLNARRWRNFKSNKRAFWSLILFSILFGLSLFAEVLANDKPLLVQYRGEWRMPFMQLLLRKRFRRRFQDRGEL